MSLPCIAAMTARDAPPPPQNLPSSSLPVSGVGTSSPRIWSRETGSAVPSRVSLLVPHTQAESGTYSRNSSRFPRRRPFIYLERHTPLGQCRLYRVAQSRTNDVNCRESAGTGPVVLKVVPVTDAAILQVTMDHLICTSLFPHPLLV